MAIPVARVHLKVAHAALPALLPTPPKWNMLPAPLLPTSCLAAAILPKPPLAKPSRADADERWDARKIKPASAEPSALSASTGLRSADGAVRSTAGHGSSLSQRKNATSMSGRADAVGRWDAHKKAAASPASSSPSSSSGKWTSRRSSSSAERWDMHKKPCLPQAKLLDDGESSSCSTDSNDIDTEEEEEEEEEEEILWKPRAMYAGPGFVVAAPESSMLPMPAFLVPVA